MGIVDNKANVKSTHYLLVRSNDNPSHKLNDLTWTLISSVPKANLSQIEIWDQMLDFSCAVDDEGVFTVIAQNYFTTGLNGLQFQPVGNPDQPEGTWKNITIPKVYPWITMKPSTLISIKSGGNGQDGSSMNKVFHAFLDKNGSDVMVAELDTTKMTMVLNPSPWKPTVLKRYTMYGLAFVNNTLQLYGHGFSVNEINGLFLIPFNSQGSPPTAGNVRSFDATEIFTYCGNNVSLRPLKERTIVFCTYPRPAHIFIYDDGSKQLTHLPAARETYDSDNLLSLIPFPGSPYPYIFMHDLSGIYSIPLEGPLAREKINANKNFTIPDYFFTPPNGIFNAPPGNSGPPSNGDGNTNNSTAPKGNPDEGQGHKSGTLHPGVIGGISAAVIVAIAIVLCVLFRRRTQSKREEGIQKEGGAKGKRKASISPKEEEPPTPKAVVTEEGTRDIREELRASEDSAQPLHLTFTDVRMETHPGYGISSLTGSSTASSIIEPTLSTVPTLSVSPPRMQPALLEEIAPAHSPQPPTKKTQLKPMGQTSSIFGQSDVTNDNALVSGSIYSEYLLEPLSSLTTQPSPPSPFQVHPGFTQNNNNRANVAGEQDVNRLASNQNPQTTPFAYNIVPPGTGWLSPPVNNPHTKQ
ncbi:hypothetical protein BX616_003664 [Lobosporangium transversale]|nr:hypothetical protein BX616_003664 [Lobosporangium transversale]